MTQRVEPVPLIAGPSNGKTYRPVSRWPMYLNGQGESIKAPDGDRIMRGGRTKATGCYMKEMHEGKVACYFWVRTKITHAIVDV